MGRRAEITATAGALCPMRLGILAAIAERGPLTCSELLALTGGGALATVQGHVAALRDMALVTQGKARGAVALTPIGLAELDKIEAAVA